MCTDYTDLAYIKTVNAPGRLRFDAPAASQAAQLIQYRSIVEAWRRNLSVGLDWYRDFSAIYLDTERQYTDTDTLSFVCAGSQWLLFSRIISWFAATANRSAFVGVPAETIMKTLVEYNAGPSALMVNGRQEANGNITGLTVQADAGGGTVRDWYCAYDRLLPSLQKLAPIAGGDFDLVQTGSATFQFRFYAGQLGTDRTATVVFDLLRGNMANPKYSFTRSSAVQRAIIGGQGNDATRLLSTVTGLDYAAGLTDIEMFVDARDIPLAAGVGALDDRGLSKLSGVQSREKFQFDVIQTASAYYGLHYFLGDLVTAVRWFDRATVIEKVNSVGVQFQKDGAEIVDVQMQEV